MNRRASVVAVVALLFLTSVAYLPALRNGFIWDDDDHITQNPAMTAPDGLERIWSSLAVSRYYPLTLTTFWLERRVWGLDPLPYHAANILLHAFNAALLYVLLRRLNVRGAWAAAALWAVHPVNAESVAWATELKNVQSGVFFLLTTLCFLQFERQRHRGWYSLSLLCFGAALLSKPSTVVLPPALLLIAWWQRDRVQRRDVLRTLPLFGMAAAMAVMTIIEQRGHIARAPHDWSLPLTERPVLAGKAVWFYLGKVLWPANLMFVYPRWTLDTRSILAFLPLVGTAAVAVLLWHFRKRDWGRACLFAFGYFLVALLPVLGFFDIYYFRYSFVGDHFQYLASIGPTALLAAAATTALRRPWTRAVAATVILSTFGFLSFRHTLVFHDDETLWRDTLARNGNAFVAHNNLGLILYLRNQPEQAVEHFREALQIKPDYLEAHSNLGLVLTALGRYDEAEPELQEAVRIKPDYGKAHCCLGELYERINKLEDAKHQYALAIQFQPSLAQAHYDLGCIWQEQGQRERAIACYKNALLFRPDYAEAHINLANLLAEDGNLRSAIEHDQLALKADPDLGRVHYDLGLKLAELNRSDEATEHFRQAIRLMPAFGDAYVQLAKLLSKNGRFSEAIAVLKSGLTTNPPNPAVANDYARLLVNCPVAELRNTTEAIRIAEALVKASGPKQPEPLDTLAAAYAEAGRFEEAGTAAREAVAAAQAMGKTNLAAQISSRLALYENHQSLRTAQP
ncbi:MAG TPA: tetratricopeptide repeat protein [Verrucomicrobiae bacterium]|nr:tetratricopeptide repeat protein [Verrucomicrobiae bacterium]